MNRLLDLLWHYKRRLRRDRRGTVAVMSVGIMAGMLGLGGMAIDIGVAMQTKQALQAAVDAAALAGADQINATAASPAAITTATSWSAVATGKNAIKGVTATMISGYPKTLCLATLKSAPYSLPCTAPGGNALQVAMTAQVPLVFGALVGVRNFTVNAVATATVGGGTGTPLDIALIVDTTQSMTRTDANCSIRGATRVQCAMAGARTLLTLFNPSLQQVALFTFPGVTTGTTLGREYCTPTGTIGSPSTTVKANNIAYYNQSPVYQIVPFSADYKTSPAATTLNASSSLVKAVGGVTGCSGIQVVGGAGTYYADAVTAAQSYLTLSGRAKTQKVIIVLSDGDASASTAPTKPVAGKDECKAAVTAAATATANGTWVYTLAYGAPSSGCSTDTVSITPCKTLQTMASKPSMFFSDNASSCPGATTLSDMVAAFTKLGLSLQQRILIPDNTV